MMEDVAERSHRSGSDSNNRMLARRHTYLSGDVRFLTFKGALPKHQKMSFVENKIRPYSKNYIIVREKNKKSEGYHFHAIIKLNRVPKAQWYIKGVHMHLQKVGNRLAVNSRPLTKEEVLEYVYTVPEKKQTLISQLEERLVELKIDQTVKKNDDVSRVLSYMAKEFEFPAQYTDYIICESGKMTLL